MTTRFNHSKEVTSLVLAGGRAHRMGGQDKGLLPLAGSSLIEHCVSALSSHVQQILISANRNITQYEKFGFPVLKDSSGDYDGPLAGLQRGLENSPNMPVLVVPCDAPLLTELLSHQLLERLWDAYQQDDCVAAIPHDGTRLQPLFGLYAPSALKSLTDYLASGQRKVESWATSLPHVIVDCSDQEAAFMNINTEEDLLRAESILANEG